MGRKMLEKLADEYINSGGDLLLAMEKAGYSTEKSNVSQMRHSDRFRRAVREGFDRAERRILAEVAQTGKGEARSRALRRLRQLIFGESETHSPGEGEKPDNKDEQLPDTAW